jgi:hypothetical protein
MTITIFYSWQSDIPNNLNRNFIELALEKAITRLGQDMEIQAALRDEAMEIDKDTKGIPGTPPIVDVIFNKISKCGVFVPDLTFVGKSINDRLLPNPNVLIEYGWALRELSYSRIIAVMNSAFGEPTDANMPFDMRHLRRPITYHLEETAGKDERAKIKESLVKDLYFALEAIVKSGILTQSHESQKDFDGMPSTSNPSTFLQTGETFTQGLIIPDTQRLFLRIIPRRPVDSIRSSKFALDLVQTGNLLAMSQRKTSYLFGRNRHGAYSYAEEDGKIINVTQLFKSGELWGIDADAIDKRRLIETSKRNNININFGFFPSVALETIFVRTLSAYLRFAKEILKLSIPLKFIAGATNVLGYKMCAKFEGVNNVCDGEVFEEHITFEGKIEDYSQEPRIILRPFFGKVWEECGLPRPDEEKLS